MRLIRLLLAAGLSVAGLWAQPAEADQSRCTATLRAMGYFILDVDSDWDRPFDKFSAVKNGKEYDIWVNRANCRIVHSRLDDDRRWYDD